MKRRRPVMLIDLAQVARPPRPSVVARLVALLTGQRQERAPC